MVISVLEGFKIRVFETGTDLALAVADRVCELADARADRGETMVLGLAAGGTPRGVYRALEFRRRTGQLRLEGASAFGLDEYYPMGPSSPNALGKQLTRAAMDMGLDLSRLRLLRGDLSRDAVARHCADFEMAIRRSGGIDLQLLGVGRNGHIAFNEPGSSARSRTRMVDLDEQTRRDAASSFGGLDATPMRAVTMGMGTILESRELALLATGSHKADVVRRMVEGEMSSLVPASLLRGHPNITVYLDGPAASMLTSLTLDPGTGTRLDPSIGGLL